MLIGTLHIVSLGTTNSATFDHDSITSDDRGGIAASDTHVFYTGDNQTGVFPLDLSSGAGVGARFDALVSDLGSETVYSLGTSSTTPAPQGGGTITHLLVHDGVTGALTGESVELSSPITLTHNNGQAGIFAGIGGVVVWNRSTGTVSEIDAVTGEVTTLGTVGSLNPNTTENWAFWGVAEHFGGDDYLTYRSSSGNDIVRTRISDGATTTVASFPAGLSDLAAFTLSVPTQRWYFHYEGSSSTFGGSSETVGFADADIKTFVRFASVSPDPRTEPVGSIDITFDTPIDPATFDFNDLTVTRGGSSLDLSTVTVTPVVDNTYRIGNLAGLTTLDGNYVLTITGAGILDSSMVPLEGTRSESWVTRHSLPSATAIAPLGSLVYETSESRSLPTPTDVQNLQIALDAGQQFRVVIDPTDSLQVSVTVTDPSGGLLGTETASAAGETLILEDLMAASAGTYTIAVSAAGGTTGSFQLQLLLNAAVEDESIGGPTNDTLLTAQNIDGSFIGLNAGWAERGAVIGNVGDALYSVSRNNNLLRTIDPLNGSTLSNVPITLLGASVSFSDGIAIDPTTGVIYASIFDSNTSSDLVTIDPATGNATRVGDLAVFGRRFGEIVFDANGNLYGITGGSNASSEPNSLFAIDKANPGIQSLLYSFPSQGSGGVALNTDNGFLYRYDDGLFQSIDVSQLPVVVTDLPLPGGSFSQGTGMTYAGAGEFWVSNPDNLYLLHADGTWTNLGNIGSRPHGLALAQTDPVDVYAFSLAAGQTATLAVEFDDLSSPTLELLDDSDTVLATGITDAANVTQFIANFTAPTSDTYYVRLGSTGKTDYRLLLTRHTTFDTELNDALDQAQNIQGIGTVLGRVGEPSQLLAADDGDEHLLLVDPTTGASTIVASNVAEGRGYTDLAYNSATRTLYGSQGEGRDGLFVINTVTWNEVEIGEPGDGIQAMAWSPDGSTLYAVRRGTFGTIDPAEGSFTAIGDPDIGNIGGIAFQPGTDILFAVTSKDPGLYTLNLMTGEATFVGDPGNKLNSLEFLPDGTLLAGVTGGDESSANSGNLVRLDPTTAAATLIGPLVASGDRNPTGLELLPGDPADYYSVTLGAGIQIGFATLTPSGGPGEFVNTLDPRLDLYDPTGTLVASNDNGALDGRNAQLNFTTIMSGRYTVRVTGANNTQGEYVLNTTGLSDVAPALTVLSTNPPDGQPLQSFTTLELTFSQALVLASITASDLTVDGQPATQVTLIDGNTLSFDIAALQPIDDGPVTIMIAAGALQGVQGTSNEDFTMTLIRDRMGPVVTASSLAPDGVTESGDVTVTLTFNEALNPATLNTSDVSLVEIVSGVSTTASSLIYDDASHQITMQFPNLRDGSYRLTLDSAATGVKDVAGNELNGSPSVPLPSGQDDPAADDFVLTFNVDTTVAAFPVPLSPLDPLGSLIYTGALESRIAPTDDTDRYTLTLDAGQKFSVLVDPRGGLHASVTVTDPSASAIGNGTASAAGEPLVLDNLIAASAGIYTIAVSAAEETTGDFYLQVVLNAAVETENADGPTNDTLLTAQNIDGSFNSLNEGTAERGAVVGTVGDALYSASRNDNLLRTIDPSNGSTISSVGITVPGGEVDFSEGIAIDPTTDRLYGIIRDESDGTFNVLVTIDPATGVAARIGDMSVSGRRFGEIVFDANGNLYGVTGGRDSDPSSLFAIDKANPSNQTLLYNFPTQGSGGVALNTDDGRLYRYDDGVLQSIDVSQSPVVVTNLPLPDGSINQGTGMTYAGAGEFLVSNPDNLFLLHADGTWTNLGDINGRPHGLALAQTGVVDVYAFSLAAGQTATLAVDFDTGISSTLELLDSEGTILAEGTTDVANVAQIISNFTAPSSDTYYVRLGSSEKADYRLLITRNAAFDTEFNNDSEHAQNIDATQQVLGHVGEPPALLVADDGDFHLLVVDPTSGEATIVASVVANERGYIDLAYNSTTGMLYGSQGESSDGFFVIDSMRFNETLVGNSGNAVHAMAWSPDNSTLYAVRRGTFGTIDPANGNFTTIGNPGIGNIGGIAFQPGTGILFAVTSRDPGLYTLNLMTGEATFVGNPGVKFNSLEFLPDGTLLAGVTGGDESSANSGNLMRLDPLTAAPTLIGSMIATGHRNPTGLELLPGDPVDCYSITVDEGQTIDYWTQTPSDGVGEFANTLDPRLELYDPNGDLVASDDNSAPDGRNAQLSFIADLSGTYTLRVSGANDTRGEYVLSAALLDFGDAPVPLGGTGYPTLLANDGARHLLDADGPHLGQKIDGDFDGTPTPTADGDDVLDGNDDEDGVTFAANLKVSVTETRTGHVTVNASAAAQLDAWIDFNRDSDWNDAGEHIFDNLTIVDGDNQLDFTIPAGAAVGTTFSRFRLSTAGGLAPTGLAADGEVEDQSVTFYPELVEVVVSYGNLTITDFGGQSNDIMVISDQLANEFVISSPRPELTADGLTPTNTVRIARELVTGGLIADLSDGDDRLRLDALLLNATVHGGEGNDTILGGSSHDSLFGEEGNDSVRGSLGNDIVSGGAGSDTVTGDEGTDTQREESNATHVVVTSRTILGIASIFGETETIGSGINVIELFGGDAATFMDASTSSRSVILHGGDGDDTLLGGSQADQLLGGDGDDSLNGSGGHDSLDGGDDDDFLTGGSGNDLLGGGDGTNTLLETHNGGFTLTDTSLLGIGTDTLASLQIAHLIGGASSNTFTVSGWTGTGTLVGAGGSDTIVAIKNGNVELSNSRLQASDDMDLALSGFTKAKLTGGDGDDTFEIGEWTGSGTVIGGAGDDTIVANRNANHTLTNTSLVTVGFGTLTLSGLENAELAGGAGNNTFTVSGWTGDGRLTGGGGIDTLVKSKNANFELSDEQLSTSDGMDLELDGLRVTNLTGGSSANVFIVSEWHGIGMINGSSGTDRIEATRDANTTLTNAMLSSIVEVNSFNGNGGFGTLNLTSIEAANLSGGESDNTLNANGFSKGSVTLQGGAGNDVLIGGSKKDVLNGGSGRDLLIGGADKDTLNGETNDDILIGGTSTHSGNMTALAALMSEWTSENDYADRVSNLLNGGGANGTTRLTNTTVQNDSNSADSLTGGADTDWFFESANDVLDALLGETVTPAP